MNTNSIQVDNLTKKFGRFTAVDSLSFKVKEGSVFGFLGANGAGKSTTIRMLCGLLEPTSGDAILGGFSLTKDPDKIKQNIGYMSQHFSLYNDLTVEENINFFAGIYGLNGSNLTERKKWVLKTAYLEGKEHLLTGSLPLGVKQRLALGTAVIHKPDIIFLDEPTSGVDPISRRNFWDLISELSEEGVTVLVTTHYLEEAEYCNNIILINAGKLIAEGNPNQLKKNYIENPIFEIECNQVVEAMQILEKKKYIEETSIFGNSLHVMVNQNYNTIEQIKQPLNNSNITIKHIDTIIPTLEDVFIHLLAKDESTI
jgi:ABC-2 type transport system ATP-binding protein